MGLMGGLGMKTKTKKKPRIYKDKKGEYIKERYFCPSGKQRFRKIYVIDGIPAEEFYDQNADPITLLKNGDYDLLHQKGF